MIEPNDDPNDYAARVRQNTVGAGIAAALLLYFAYSGGGFRVPEGDDAFAIGGGVFIHTLELGGFAMLAAALLSATGMRHALLFDAVSSILIGILFCVSAALMMIGGGSGLLYIMFGIMFVIGGKRNATRWAAMAPDGRSRGGFPSTITSAPDEDADHVR